MSRFRREWNRFRDRFPARELLVGCAVALPLALAGVAGYMAGTPSSVDIDAVTASATIEGREAGEKDGLEAGFAKGFKTARNRSYAAEYAAAYREAYEREFERADLDPPPQIRVPEPR